MTTKPYDVQASVVIRYHAFMYLFTTYLETTISTERILCYWYSASIYPESHGLCPFMELFISVVMVSFMSSWIGSIGVCSFIKQWSSCCFESSLWMWLTSEISWLHIKWISPHNLSEPHLISWRSSERKWDSQRRGNSISGTQHQLLPSFQPASLP